jgi:hypothetical protein
MRALARSSALARAAPSGLVSKSAARGIATFIPPANDSGATDNAPEMTLILAVCAQGVRAKRLESLEIP